MSIENEYIDHDSQYEVKQIRVSFNVGEVVGSILPSLWASSKDYSSHYVAEEIGKALLKDYNLRDTGYQLLHTYYDQICDADKRVIDDTLSEVERGMV